MEGFELEDDQGALIFTLRDGVLEVEGVQPIYGEGRKDLTCLIELLGRAVHKMPSDKLVFNALTFAMERGGTI